MKSPVYGFSAHFPSSCRSPSHCIEAFLPSNVSLDHGLRPAAPSNGLSSRRRPRRTLPSDSNILIADIDLDFLTVMLRNLDHQEVLALTRTLLAILVAFGVLVRAKTCLRDLTPASHSFRESFNQRTNTKRCLGRGPKASRALARQPQISRHERSSANHLEVFASSMPPKGQSAALLPAKTEKAAAPANGEVQLRLASDHRSWHRAILIRTTGLDRFCHKRRESRATESGIVL